MEDPFKIDGADGTIKYAIYRKESQILISI